MIRALITGALCLITGLNTGAPAAQKPAPYNPPVRSPQLKAWTLLARQTATYGIRHRAPEMYRVLYRESRFEAKAKNPKSSAAGIAQYTKRTWMDHSRRAGLPPAASPYDPKAAIRAMAWAWSRGGERHWRKTLDRKGR